MFFVFFFVLKLTRLLITCALSFRFFFLFFLFVFRSTFLTNNTPLFHLHSHTQTEIMEEFVAGLEQTLRQVINFDTNDQIKEVSHFTN